MEDIKLSTDDLFNEARDTRTAAEKIDTTETTVRDWFKHDSKSFTQCCGNMITDVRGEKYATELEYDLTKSLSEPKVFIVNYNTVPKQTVTINVASIRSLGFIVNDIAPKKETPEACINERAARLSCLRMSKIAKSYLVDNSQYYFDSFTISQLGKDLLTFFGLTFSLNIMKAKSLEECEIAAAADGHSRSAVSLPAGAAKPAVYPDVHGAPQPAQRLLGESARRAVRLHWMDAVFQPVFPLCDPFPQLRQHLRLCVCHCHQHAVAVLLPGNHLLRRRPESAADEHDKKLRKMPLVYPLFTGV